MRIKFRVASVFISALTLFGAANITTVSAGDESSIEQGKKIALDRKKGNCLACHVMGDGEQPGNIGPPLIVMKARYPDKAKLRQQIYDARIKNQNTSMPPFGAHGILSDDDIDKLTDYIHSL